MGRSPGFGSTACNSIALFRLAFAAAPSQNELTLLQTVTPRLIMQKARRQATRTLRLLVSTRFQVLFHSPSRSAFHLSLTGTGSLSVTREYLALEGGPPRFPQGFPCPVVLGNTNQRVDCHFAYRTITFCGRTFQTVSAIVSIFDSPASLRPCPKVPHNPACTTHAGFNIQAV